jgi:hypothetical protein
MPFMWMDPDIALVLFAAVVVTGSLIMDSLR